MPSEKGKDVTSPGPSKEYKDLLNGTIGPDQYVEEVKKDVDRRLEEGTRAREAEPDERAAAG
jgi:hypothetical protein